MSSSADDHDSIDIPHEQLEDWLINRAKLQSKPAQITLQLQLIESSFKKALSTLPNNMKTVLSTELAYSTQYGINYFLAKKILNELIQSQSTKGNPSTKNWLGQYTDPTLKQWNDLINSYENKSLYLAESSRLILQYCNYSIPALKKSIQSSLQQITECKKKQKELISSAKQNRSKLESFCSSLGINNSNLHLSSQLESHAIQTVDQQLVKLIQNIQGGKINEAIDYYREFVRFTLSVANNSNSTNIPDSHLPSLSALTKVLNQSFLDLTREEAERNRKYNQYKSNGNSNSNQSSDEFGIELSGSGIDSTDNNTNNPSNSAINIDWTALSGSKSTENSTESVHPPVMGKIDWDSLVDDHTRGSSESVGSINWDLTIEESGNQNNENNNNNNNHVQSITHHSPALIGLLEDDLRQQFLTDLLELESFLLIRLTEFDSSSLGLGSSNHSDSSTTYSALSSLFSSSDHSIIQSQSQSTVEILLQSVRSILTEFRSSDLQRLISIRTSSRFTERLTHSIQAQLNTINRIESNQRKLIQRQSTLECSLSADQSRLEYLIQSICSIKSLMEQSVSKLFQNRKVTLIGEINQYC